MDRISLKSATQDWGLTLAEIARRMGVNKSTVTRWNMRGIPAERVLDVERVTGISRHDLRPDIFGPAPEKETA